VHEKITPLNPQEGGRRKEVGEKRKTSLKPRKTRRILKKHKKNVRGGGVPPRESGGGGGENGC